MNKTRMLELADAIEAAPPHKFDMQSFVGKYKIDKAGRRRRQSDAVRPSDALRELRNLSCGTSACLAGWAVHLHPRAGLSDAYVKSLFAGYRYYDVASHAQAILGLTDDEADTLFYTRMGQTNVEAAAFLRRCAALGTVPER